MTLLQSIDTTTLVYILIFAFATVALLVLPAASFIQLVGLIVSNGSKVAALEKAVQQVLMHLSLGTGTVTASVQKEDTPITPESPSGNPTGSTQVTKSPKSS